MFTFLFISLYSASGLAQIDNSSLIVLKGGLRWI